MLAGAWGAATSLPPPSQRPHSMGGPCLLQQLQPDGALPRDGQHRVEGRHKGAARLLLHCGACRLPRLHGGLTPANGVLKTCVRAWAAQRGGPAAAWHACMITRLELGTPPAAWLHHTHSQDGLYAVGANGRLLDGRGILRHHHVRWDASQLCSKGHCCRMVTTGMRNHSPCCNLIRQCKDAVACATDFEAATSLKNLGFEVQPATTQLVQRGAGEHLRRTDEEGGAQRPPRVASGDGDGAWRWQERQRQRRQAAGGGRHRRGRQPAGSFI